MSRRDRFWFIIVLFIAVVLFSGMAAMPGFIHAWEQYKTDCPDGNMLPECH